MTRDGRVVMLSSTVLDLERHREKARDACLACGCRPEMMENLTAMGGDAIDASLALVDRAEVYLGVFGFRRGYVPPGQGDSITEMELERARERGMPVRVFLMHADHDLKFGDVETGAGAERVGALRARLETEHVVAYFRSPEELHSKIVQALHELEPEADEAPPPAGRDAAAPSLAAEVDM